MEEGEGRIVEAMSCYIRFKEAITVIDTGLLPVGEQDFKFHELAVGEVASLGKCQDISSRERARLKYVPCLEFLGRKERCLLLYSLLALEILTMLPSEGLPSAPNACRRMFRTYSLSQRYRTTDTKQDWTSQRQMDQQYSSFCSNAHSSCWQSAQQG